MTKTPKAQIEPCRAAEILRQLKDGKHDYGEVMLLASNEIAPVPTISTGIYSLNLILSGHPNGGFAQGRIVEVFGPPGGGKTTTTLHALAATQARGGVAAFIDAEHALDAKYAQTLGVKLEELLIAQPDNGEQALELASGLASTMSAGDLIVVDSVAALVPKAELDGEMGDQHVGLRARLMSQAMRKLSGTLAKNMVTAVFINQLIDKMMVIMGAKTETPGGKALKFYATQRIEVQSIGKNKAKINGKEEFVGHTVKYTAVKNKIYPPFRSREAELKFGFGIPPIGDLLNLATELGIVKKSGTWYTYQGEQIGQGFQQAIDYLTKETEVLGWIKGEVLGRYDGTSA